MAYFRPRPTLRCLTQIAIWTSCRIALAWPKWNLLSPTRLLSGVSTPFWRSAHDNSFHNHSDYDRGGGGVAAIPTTAFPCSLAAGTGFTLLGGSDWRAKAAQHTSDVFVVDTPAAGCSPWMRRRKFKFNSSCSATGGQHSDWNL